MKNLALDTALCKGIITWADFQRMHQELREMAHEIFAKTPAEQREGRDFWREAEERYFRFHFVGDTAGNARTTFGFNKKVSDFE
jgi:hypothetical protein